MIEQRPFSVAIIGGGLSGTLVAIQLLRTRTGSPIKIYLIEKDLPLINTSEESSQTPKRIYGDYAKFLLVDAEKDKSANISFERVYSEAVSVTTDTEEHVTTVFLKNHRAITVNKVVLSVGNLSGKHRVNHSTEFKRIYDTLITDMRNRLLIRPARDGGLLDSNKNGALLDATGKVSPLLYSFGSLRRVNLWGTMAVRGLPEQARDLVEELLVALQSATVTEPRKDPVIPAAPWQMPVPGQPASFSK